MATKKFKVDIHPGHGGSDPGAVKYVKEVHGNFVSSKACKEMLEYNGVSTHMERTKETQTEHLEAELANAKKWGADIFIDPHENAGEGDGCEVWVRKGDTESIKLANLILEEMGKIGQNSRGVKYNDKLRFLIATKGKVAVLPEAFFVDNKNDVKIGDTDKELKEIGYAYARAILRYKGYKPKEIQPKQPAKKAYSGKFPTKTIQLNDRGLDVHNWQAFLKWYGYKITVGSEKKATFKSNTLDKTKKFQKAMGLEVDGICGPKTVAKAKTVKK